MQHDTVCKKEKWLSRIARRICGQNFTPLNWHEACKSSLQQARFGWSRLVGSLSSYMRRTHYMLVENYGRSIHLVFDSRSAHNFWYRTRKFMTAWRKFERFWCKFQFTTTSRGFSFWERPPSRTVNAAVSSKSQRLNFSLQLSVPLRPHVTEIWSDFSANMSVTRPTQTVQQ